MKKIQPLTITKIKDPKIFEWHGIKWQEYGNVSKKDTTLLRITSHVRWSNIAISYYNNIETRDGINKVCRTDCFIMYGVHTDTPKIYYMGCNANWELFNIKIKEE